VHATSILIATCEGVRALPFRQVTYIVYHATVTSTHYVPLANTHVRYTCEGVRALPLRMVTRRSLWRVMVPIRAAILASRSSCSKWTCEGTSEKYEGQAQTLAGNFPGIVFINDNRTA
jgi:hypothetical protein